VRDVETVCDQNRVGSKFGGGGVAGASETNVDRRERLRKLALETIDLAKVCSSVPFIVLTQCSQDPYILRNHLGSLECRLCLTLHTNEGSYLAHTQGKKHQTNLARRAARDAKDTQLMIAPTQTNIQRKVFLKIGRPGYRVTKVRDRDTGKEGMMVQVHLPQITGDVLPRRRFMSAWEQKREPPNKAYQYLIVRMFNLKPKYLSDWIISRSRQNHTKPSLSVFLPVKSKTKLMMRAIGIGPIGILIPSNIAFNSCSVWLIDLLGSKVLSYDAYHLSISMKLSSDNLIRDKSVRY